MATRDLLKLARLGKALPAQADSVPDSAPDVAPLSGTRAQMMQRLQVGLSGLAAMVLLVALANIIQGRVRDTEARSIPEAAPTVAPIAPPPLSDPLADAGVVPDLPAEPAPVQQQAIVPEQGRGNDAEGQ